MSIGFLDSLTILTGVMIATAMAAAAWTWGTVTMRKLLKLSPDPIQNMIIVNPAPGKELSVNRTHAVDLTAANEVKNSLDYTAAAMKGKSGNGAVS